LTAGRPRIQPSEIELVAAGFHAGEEALRGLLEVGRFSGEGWRALVVA
jgi:hypothetical protein